MYSIIIYPADGPGSNAEDQTETTYTGLEFEGADWVDNILRDEISFDIVAATQGMADYRRILDSSDRLGDVCVTDQSGENWIIEVSRIGD